MTDPIANEPAANEPAANDLAANDPAASGVVAREAAAGRLGVGWSRRERAAVLALAGAAVLWRWLVGLRTPLPGIDACHDLWLAQRVAVGDVGALATSWENASWAAALAPVIACGAAPFTAAKVVAAVLGGLTVVVVALTAERLREGAGAAAGVLATVAAGSVVAAGAASGAALGAFFVALAAWGIVAGRWPPVLVAAVLMPVPWPERLVATTTWLRELRLGGTLLAAFVCLVLLPPRPRRAWPLVGMVVVLGIVVAATAPPSAWLPTWSPLLAVLGGVGLVRLPRRGRDALLAVVVLVECHGAWHEIEPREAAVERALGRHVARRLAPEEHVAGDLPRVLWAAGARPTVPESDAEWAAIAADPLVAIVVASARRADALVAAAGATTFARFDLPADLADLAAERDVVILLRRRRS